MLLQSTVYSLTNSTQILSLFCRWCLAIGEMETKQTSHRTEKLGRCSPKANSEYRKKIWGRILKQCMITGGYY